MKKIIALLLSATLVLGCLPAAAETTKHERVYVVSTADGTVKSITDSVRLENADGLDEIEDRTMLTGIENAGGKETFTLEGETLTWAAKGKDIVYQGTSEKAPAVIPTVTLTLDGEAVSFADLKDKTGDAVLTVSYRQETQLPMLAVTVMPLPESGISALKTENAAVLTEMGRQILVGWAVPGMDEKLKLPGSFTVSFHADHADLQWMMTFSTADPVEAVRKALDGRMNLDIQQEMEDAKLLLTAMKDGKPMPETTGKTKDAAVKINALNSGLEQLNDGATALADGTSQVSTGAEELKTGAAALDKGAKTLASGTKDAEKGAAELDEGLKTLTANNEALNAGADTIFAAVLASANEQLAASGLAAAGITLPQLTRENYAEVLDPVLEQLNPETLKKAAAAQGVDASAAAVTQKLAMAQAAYESLSGLKAQLDQVNAFVTGLQEYTAGTAKAAAGAAKLHTGLTQLNTGAAGVSGGAASLSTGAATLAEGAAKVSVGAGTLQYGIQMLKNTLTNAEKEAAKKLLPYLENEASDALGIYEEIRTKAGNGGYDLRPDGMKTVTVYIIRTDLK